jgi:hypothetical protein
MVMIHYKVLDQQHRTAGLGCQGTGSVICNALKRKNAPIPHVRA